MNCEKGDERVRKKMIIEMRRKGEVFLSGWMERGRRFLWK